VRWHRIIDVIRSPKAAPSPLSQTEPAQVSVGLPCKAAEAIQARRNVRCAISVPSGTQKSAPPQCSNTATALGKTDL
jgi:hypothetical protein